MVVTATPPHQFRHLALFYRGRDEYLAALGDFIRASRARGHAVFAAVPGGKPSSCAGGWATTQRRWH